MGSRANRSLPELLRRSIAQRTMRAFPVIFPPPVCQSRAHIVQGAEPACVQALVPQPSVEALHIPVLHRPSGLDMHEGDLPLLGPADHAARGELRSIVRAHAFW